jgi:hypothetical protein
METFEKRKYWVKYKNSTTFLQISAKDFTCMGVLGVMLMKKIRKKPSFNSALILLIAVISVQSMVGQSVASETALVSSISKPAAPYTSKVIDLIQLEKLNLKDALSYLREEFEGVQFVTNGPVERLTVDIELRSVNLSNVLKAIEIQLEGQVRIKTLEDNLVAVYAQVPPAPKPVLRAYSIIPFMETKLVEASQKYGNNLEAKELEN